eukprot:SAG31_NODE_391_length_16344_cov_15.753339_4_plen_131_part_00
MCFCSHSKSCVSELHVLRRVAVASRDEGLAPGTCPSSKDGSGDEAQTPPSFWGLGEAKRPSYWVRCILNMHPATKFNRYGSKKKVAHSPASRAQFVPINLALSGANPPGALADTLHLVPSPARAVSDSQL